MQPKIKNATFATQCNPYQKMSYNSYKHDILTKISCLRLKTKTPKAELSNRA